MKVLSIFDPWNCRSLAKIFSHVADAFWFVTGTLWYMGVKEGQFVKIARTKLVKEFRPNLLDAKNILLCMCSRNYSLIRHCLHCSLLSCLQQIYWKLEKITNYIATTPLSPPQIAYKLIEAGRSEDILQVQGLSIYRINSSKDTTIQKLK